MKVLAIHVFAVASGFLLIGTSAMACDTPVSLCERQIDGALPLIERGTSAKIIVDATDHSGVRVAAANLTHDLSVISRSDNASDVVAVIIGTLDGSATIRRLIDAGKIDPAPIKGQWEAYLQTVVDHPQPGIERALVIIGADPRGAIYGTYDVAARAGMSPWHYWADVPPTYHSSLFAVPGSRHDAPKVKYRGIFLNDENPALYGFANDTFGGFNAQFYEKVFDLILRQKGNFIWPAMWGKAFYDDDPTNGELAERMGMVIGTSHHEPLMRAHVEWARYGEGPWNYETNTARLRAFWRSSLERLGDGEALVTVGMRGDGDEAMTEGTAIDLLERIVRDQRELIAEVSGKPAAATPQVWALYKEVQDYFDKGMQVPDDVTLLFADDNWGNIRRLPKRGMTRPGGYGVYYHFDYVGGPRNYKWLNTTQIERTWKQMDQAWQRGVDRLWIVNVGDLKPMELPISFFLDQAWNPDLMTMEQMDQYATRWAASIFGSAHADDIGKLLETYTKYTSRRKPELIDALTFRVETGEWDARADEFLALAAQADKVRSKITKRHDDAYVQLVWFPIHAMANLYDMYRAVAHNRLLAEQSLPAANHWADRARAAYARDSELTRIYHEDIADGKWNHMMSQTHIGYTYWQQPEEQVMPTVTDIDAPQERGVYLWAMGELSGAADRVALPTLNPINAADGWVDLHAASPAQLRNITVSGASSRLSARLRKRADGSVRVLIQPDWSKIPAGLHQEAISLDTRDGTKTIVVAMEQPIWAESVDNATAIIGTGVTISPDTAACMISTSAHRWRSIPNLGRVGSAVGLAPSAGGPFSLEGAPSLYIPVQTIEEQLVDIDITVAPSFDVDGGDGLGLAIAVGDAAPTPLSFDLHPDTAQWNAAVSDNALQLTSNHRLPAGASSIRIWALHPSVVIQSVSVRPAGSARSYLGPSMAGTASARRCPDNE